MFAQVFALCLAAVAHAGVAPGPAVVAGPAVHAVPAVHAAPAAAYGAHHLGAPAAVYGAQHFAAPAAVYGAHHLAAPAVAKVAAAPAVVAAPAVAKLAAVPAVAKAVVAEPVYPPHPYSFGYDTVDEHGSRSFHHETSDANNFRKGSYGYTDAYGVFRVVEYVADAHGFRANVRTNEPGTAASAPAGVLYDAKPLAVKTVKAVAATPVVAKAVAPVAVAAPAVAKFAAAPVAVAAPAVAKVAAAPVVGAAPAFSAHAVHAAPAFAAHAGYAAPAVHVGHAAYAAPAVHVGHAAYAAPAVHVGHAAYAAPVAHVGHAAYAAPAVAHYGAAPVGYHHGYGHHAGVVAKGY